MSQKREPCCCWRVLKDTYSPFKWLKKYAPRELVFVYVMKLLESYSCYSLLYVLLTYLTEEFGFSDIEAGWIYAIMGTATSVYGLLVGSLIDALGVKLSLIIGFGILLISRIGIVFVTSKIAIIFILFTLFPFGSALGIPVLQIAVKRYTFEYFGAVIRTDKDGRPIRELGNQSVAFDLFYVMMNVSAAIVGPVLDGFRAISRQPGISSSTYHGHRFFEYRFLILSGVLANVISFIIPCLPCFRMRFKVVPPINSEACNIDIQYISRNGARSFKPRDVLMLRKRTKVEAVLAKAGLEWTPGLDQFQDAKFKLMEERNVKRSDLQIQGPYLYSVKRAGDELPVDTEVSVLGCLPGRVTRVNDNGTYDVAYDRAKDAETKELKRLIRTSNGWFAVGREDEPPYLPPEALKREQCAQCSACSVWKDRELWKYLCVVILLMGVRMVFRHVDATFPKYMIRTHGKEVPYGIIISLNPVLIVVIVGLITPFFRSVSNYDLIAWGALISAVSPFTMTGNNSISGAISFIVLLSVGEALWSPRLYEYTVIVAPDYEEGTFMAFSHMPTFLATFISGPMSGALLQNFCPAKGPLHCEMMWLIIGLCSISSPLLLFAFKKCLRSRYDIMTPTRLPEFLECCRCRRCFRQKVRIHVDDEARVGLLEAQEDHKKL